MSAAAASQRTPGYVAAVEPGSFALQAGVRSGDALLAVNGHAVQDVVDVLFYGASPRLNLTVLRAGHELKLGGRRAEGQPLGLQFTQTTFDIDIRRCNNLCPFCFVLQAPNRLRRALYIKDDDYRYSFLHGHFVTLTNLSPQDWARIRRQRLSPLYVSVHATDTRVRRACLRNETAPDVMAQLRQLARWGIRMHTQLVITPGLNDGAQLERSVRDLATLHPAVQSVSVVPVGLTRQHKYKLRPNTLAESQNVLRAVHGWQRAFRKTLGAPFVHATDEWYLVASRRVPAQTAIADLDLYENGLGQVRRFLNAWRREQRELPALRSQLAGQRLTLATGTLFAPTLQTITDKLNAAAGTQVCLAPIINTRMGATITVSGLLLGADAIDQLRPQDLRGGVVLPRVMFDHPRGITLDDLSPQDIANQLGVPVHLADLMGDVIDTLAGCNPLTFRPGDPAPLLDIAHPGGWGVEKYL